MKPLLRLFPLLAAAALCLPASALDLQRLRMMTAAEQKPWNGVGRLEVHSILGESMCTGTLIGEDLVVTAAHCVVSGLTGLPLHPDQIEFIAGARLGVQAGHSKAAKVVAHRDYAPGLLSIGDNIAHDLALVRLEHPIPGAKAPHFAIAPDPGEDAELILISYRSDRISGLTRQDGCKISAIEERVLTLGCEVIAGASGSSLFQVVDGEPRVAAVLSAMEADPGKALAYAVSAAAAIAEVMPLLE